MADVMRKLIGFGDAVRGVISIFGFIRGAGGLYARRVGDALAVMSFLFVPTHFYVPCQTSVLVAGFGVLVFLSTAVLSVLVPRRVPHRFRPLPLAFYALIAHTMCAH